MLQLRVRYQDNFTDITEDQFWILHHDIFRIKTKSPRSPKGATTLVEDRHLVRIGCTSCLPRTRNLDDRHTGILLFAPAGRNGGVGRRIDDRRSLYPTRRTNRRATRCRWNVALPPLLYLVGSTVLSKTKWRTGPRSERNLCVMFFAHFCETLYGTHLLFHCGEWVGDSRDFGRAIHLCNC